MWLLTHVYTLIDHIVIVLFIANYMYHLGLDFSSLSEV